MHHPSVPARIVPLAALIVLLTACAGLGGGASGAPSAIQSNGGRPAQSAPALETVPPSGAASTGEVPQAILDAILADAADRSDSPIADIEVVVGEAVTWSDGSLGCPEPGMAYTQALVDGFQVVLDAAGDELDYRVGGNGGFRLCETGGRPSGG